MRFIILLLAGALVAGCGSKTKLQGSWSSEGMESKTYKKVLVMAIFPNMETRAAVENAMVKELVAKGIRAKVSYDEFPMAGKAEELMAMTKEQDSTMIEKLKIGLRDKIVSKGVDGLFMINAFDVEKTQKYHSGGPSLTIAAPVYGYYPGYAGSSNPYGRGTYYDYYGYGVATTASKGYYTTSATYHIQTNFFDVTSEQLVYASQSKTVDYNDLHKEATVFSELVVNDIIDKSVIKVPAPVEPSK